MLQIPLADRVDEESETASAFAIEGFRRAEPALPVRLVGKSLLEGAEPELE